MNNNKYYEFNIQPKNESRERLLMNVFKITKIVAFVLSGVLAFMSFIYNLFLSFPAFVVICCGFALLFFQYRFNNYYDLVFVDGEIAIVKVVNNVRRKLLHKFHVKTINMIGFCGGDTYNANFKDKNVKKYVVTNVITDKDVCILCGEVDKFLVVMPFDENFLSCIMRTVGSVKFEKEFLKKSKQI